jgi:hypothetical protein
MVGTRPTFYLVPVTKALSDAVATGKRPSDRIEILKCRVAGRGAEAWRIQSTEYRKFAFQHLFHVQGLS